jgi:hypothetical protein
MDPSPLLLAAAAAALFGLGVIAGCAGAPQPVMHATDDRTHIVRIECFDAPAGTPVFTVAGQ